MINAKKWRKTIEWEKLEISSRKLEIPREHFMKDEYNKGQKWYGPDRREDIKKRFKNTQKNYTKKIFTTQIIMMM